MSDDSKKDPQEQADTTAQTDLVKEQSDDQVAKDSAYAESMRAVVMGEILNDWPQDLFIPR